MITSAKLVRIISAIIVCVAWPVFARQALISGQMVKTATVPGRPAATTRHAGRLQGQTRAAGAQQHGLFHKAFDTKFVVCSL